jgi:hypothetical protein
VVGVVDKLVGVVAQFGGSGGSAVGVVAQFGGSGGSVG